MSPPSGSTPTATLAFTARRANGAAGLRPARLEPKPALAREAHERARSLQNRIVDGITAFAGSMTFVYIHIAWFGCWIGLGLSRRILELTTAIHADSTTRIGD